MYHLLFLISFFLLLLPKCHSISTPHSLSDLYISSLHRARHIKNPRFAPTRLPVSAHSYGGYSVTVKLGTPGQHFSLLVDTGSQLTWVPCTNSYLCQNCASVTPEFLPKRSSSARLVGCKNPKCGWIHPTRTCSRTREPVACSPYFLIYGSGSTAGLLLSDVLRVSNRSFQNFGFGCSLVSDHQPEAGIAGFGRGPSSVPGQLNLTRFAYCLESLKPNITGTLILGEANTTGDVSYTPFVKNPRGGDDVYKVYYYLGVRKVLVGGRKVRLPHQSLVTGSDGGGGVIVDSGSTFTYIEPSAFKAVLGAVVEAVGGEYKRAVSVEERTGLRPCFDLGKKGAVSLPEIELHFKGGAVMKLPVENTFAFDGSDSSVACLTIVSDGGDTSLVGSGGPSIILGSFQQQNYYVEYDLERERFGFRYQSCVSA